MKPVTVHASTYGDVTELQQRGIDNIVEYLANALEPNGPLLPDTGRIIIEWGDEDGLAEIKEDAA